MVKDEVRVRVSIGYGFRNSSSLLVSKDRWRGDMERLRGAAAGCSWARRKKLGET